MTEQRYGGESFVRLKAAIESPEFRAAVHGAGITTAEATKRLRVRLQAVGTAGVALIPAARPGIAAALRLERYYLAAEALRVPRERAAQILRTAQGDSAGSTPTEQQLERAHQDLVEEDWATTMPEELRAVVRRLAAETPYSLADLTAAVDVLRAPASWYAGDPWPTEQIVRTLTQLAAAAVIGGPGLLWFVAATRAAMSAGGSTLTS